MKLLHQLLNSIQHGYNLNCTAICFSYKNKGFILQILKVLRKDGFICGFSRVARVGGACVLIKLKYSVVNLPAVRSIKKYFIPINFSVLQLHRLPATAYLTTRLGVLSCVKCLELNVGGKVLCVIS